MNDEQKVETPNNFTSQDVMNEGAKMGKDIARTTIVWTFAGMAADFIKAVVKHVNNK